MSLLQLLVDTKHVYLDPEEHQPALQKTFRADEPGLRNHIAAYYVGYFLAEETEGHTLSFNFLYGLAGNGASITPYIAWTLEERGYERPGFFNHSNKVLSPDAGREGEPMRQQPFVGRLMGAGDKVFIIMDTLDDGNDLRAALEYVRHHDAEPVGALVGFDKRLRGDSAIPRLILDCRVSVTSITDASQALSTLEIDRLPPPPSRSK